MNLVDLEPVYGQMAEFKWEINVNHFVEMVKGDSVSSPMFSIRRSVENLSLRLYPKGASNSANGYMGLYLKNNNDHDITVNFSLSLLNNDQQRVNTIKCQNETIIGKFLGWANFILESTLMNPINKLINRNRITIVVATGDKGINCGKPTNVKQVTEKLFNNIAFSDITIRANGKEFRLHKCILAAQSSEFERIFKSSMSLQQNVLDITDVDPGVLSQFFKYLYTNEVDDIKDIAGSLLCVAEKFAVTELKNLCEEEISKNINASNAIDNLKVADNHNAKKLKLDLIHFIGHNIKKVNNDQLKTLTPELLVQVISSISKD